MAKVALIVLALAGCNQVYGLDPTHLVDAEGPVRCTEQAPRFDGTPVLVVPGRSSTPGFISLRSYNITPDRTRAVGATTTEVYEGPGDSAMLGGALLSPPPPASSLLAPRLSPEADELFISYASTLDRYTRDGNTWMHQAVVRSGPTVSLSAPTAREYGPRHMLVGHSGAELFEYVETAPDQWQAVGASYKAEEFGVSAFVEVNMTSDGLHLTTGSVGVVGYASRARVEDRFTNLLTFNPFFGNPQLSDPQLTADCRRMYFISPATAAGVYYVETE